MRQKPRSVADEIRKHKIHDMECVVCELHSLEQSTPTSEHHCFKKMGGGGSHQETIPLCVEHHLDGPEAINGGQMGKKVWQAKFGTEKELLGITNEEIERCFGS